MCRVDAVAFQRTVREMGSNWAQPPAHIDILAAVTSRLEWRYVPCCPLQTPHLTLSQVRVQGAGGSLTGNISLTRRLKLSRTSTTRTPTSVKICRDAGNNHPSYVILMSPTITTRVFYTALRYKLSEISTRFSAGPETCEKLTRLKQRVSLHSSSMAQHYLHWELRCI